MPLPIAIGSKHVSSKLISPPIPSAEFEVDDTPLDTKETSSTVIFYKNILSATLTVSYYQLRGEDGNANASFACVHIQIAPLAEGFTGNFRDSTFNIKLSPRRNDKAVASSPVKAIFIHKYLACVLDSQLVIFQLRKPITVKKNPNKRLPQPPSYIVPQAEEVFESTKTKTAMSRPDNKTTTIYPHHNTEDFFFQRNQNGEIIIPVATHPRVVPQLHGVTALCDMQISMTSSNSILLAGLSDGRIDAISCRDVIVAGTLWKSELPKKIIHMSYCSRGKGGRLAVIQQNTFSIFESCTLTEKKEEINGITPIIEKMDDEDTEYHDENEELLQEALPKVYNTQEPSDFIRISLRKTHIVLVKLKLSHSLIQEENNDYFSSADWIDSFHIGILLRPRSSSLCATTHTVASVFSITDDFPKLKPVVSLLTTPQRLAEIAKGSFSTRSFANASATQLNYYAPFSCFFLSSYLMESTTSILPFVCCWHWRSNTISLALVGNSITFNGENPTYSCCFSPGLNLHKGSYQFVHIITSSDRFQKVLYPISIISPHSSHFRNNPILRPEQPLVLSSSSIIFPYCHETNSLPQNFELEWRAASIPASYLLTCGGPPIMGCIAPQRCRSIAVASPFGLCVFDAWRGNNKWKRFDRAEEVQFQVLAMDWWEDGFEEEDLLITVIKLKATNQLFLAGWSRRRLDLSHQLLEQTDDSLSPTNLWGIPLPSTFYPDSISILVPSSAPNNSLESRKAVVLLTDTGNAVEPSLLLFQLQTHILSQKAKLKERNTRTMVIKCSLALKSCVEPDQGTIFLASASFEFNLTNEQKPISDTLFTSEILENRKTDSVIAILGTITPQNSIKATIATKEKLAMETTFSKRGPISKIILSNVIDGFHFWTLELASDRSLWCWVTPPAESDYLTCRSNKTATKSLVSSVLQPPYSILSRKNGAHGHVWFGTLSCVGDSAMWMLGSTDTTRFQFAVGCVPLSKFGCLMYLGQDGSNYSHQILSQSQTDESTIVLKHEAFQVGNESIATPIFLFSLVDHFLSDEHLLSNDAELKLFAQTRSYFRFLLEKSQSISTTFTALRLLILRSVEIVASVAPKEKKSEKSLDRKEDQYHMARGFFTRIVALLNKILKPSLFANLMLSVARQIEPNCMGHLFPLPLEASSTATIEDLYLQAVERGSLATPASTLPLLSTKLSALEECKEILYHCLWKLVSVKAVAEFDTTRGERQLVQELFRFATQLELMTDVDFFSDDVKISADSMPGALSEGNHASDRNPSTNEVLTPVCGKKSRSTLSSLLTPLSCIRGRQKKNGGREVTSSFEESDDDPFDQDISRSERGAKVSVMFLTGKVLLRLCVEDGEGGWTRAAHLARIVLGDTAIDESGKGVLEWFQRSTLRSLAEAAHKLSNSFSDLDLKNHSEMTEVVTQYLSQGMLAAKKEMISTNNGAWLLELVILSLSRLSPANYYNITSHVAPSLVLLATIIGHVSGRMEDMVKGWKNKDRNNPIWTCYELAKRSIEKGKSLRLPP